MISPRYPFDVWLRSRLIQQGISGSQLAERLSVPHDTVFRWLHGMAVPPEEMYGLVAERMGVTLAELRRILALQ